MVLLFFEFALSNFPTGPISNSNEDDTALHWTIRLYNARDIQVATMHIYKNDDRELTIEAKVSYREFFHEDETLGTKAYCFW